MSVMMCSITMRPSVVPSSGGNETSPPGKAETSPRLRQTPVSQPTGLRPSITMVTSVPAGDVTCARLAARQPVAQPLGLLADLEEIRRHGPIDPAVLLDRAR